MGAPFYFFGDHDVFVLGNHTQTGGSAEGAVFVGGTATYNNYVIGTALPIVYPPNTNLISLFVLGVMDIVGGTNTQNSALSAGDLFNPPGTLIQYSMTSLGGLTGQPLRDSKWRYSLANIISWLQCDSYGWAYLPSNSTTAISNTTVTLTGTDPIQNVFTINADNIEASGTALSAVTNVNLNVPVGSTVLINVSGSSTALNNITTTINGGAPTATQAQYILWNMPIMTTLAFNSNLFGSIMAPNATVTATGFGSLYGTMFTNNLTGTLFTKSAIFAGTLPDIGSPSLSSSCSFTTSSSTTTTTTTTTTSTTTSTTSTTTTTTCPPCQYSQQISDLIASVALEEAAIANILGAEGAKIQRAIAMNATTDELLKLNKSVRNMVDTLETLESILHAKLNSVKCDDCC